MLYWIEGEKIPLKAKDLFDCASYLKDKMGKLLSKYDIDSTRTCRKENINKVGAKAMLRKNIDVKHGLVNSAIGV